ncbi:MAG: sulfatase [Anaerolineales bacterium]|nr:sulfatase [Anaerolineales bacterium]
MFKTKRTSQFHRLAMIFLVISSLAGCNVFNSAPRPNFVILLTDDLDDKLMPYLPKVNDLIGKQGATFTNYFITTPLCCPSRTSMLTGEYSHNTDILDNLPAFKRFYKNGEEAETLAVWLQREGYQTSLVGKYLNLYPNDAGRNYVPPGWTDWHSFLYLPKGGVDFYYNYTLNENGQLKEYGDKPEEYGTDVILERSLQFINQQAESSEPFFILVSFIAPHGPATPADRHADLYQDLEYPQTPSFAEADLSDKPKIVLSLALSGDEYDENDANDLFRRRVQSLQAVDEATVQILDALQKNGQLENTYVFFLSDNGFHMGEHRLPSGKGTSYEEDIRVPLMVRGPNIPAASQVTQMTANIDFAPTIAEIAHIPTADFIDGRSFLPLLNPATNAATAWRNSLLIEIGYSELAATQEQNLALVSSAPPEPDPEYPDYIYDPPRQITGGTSRAIRGEDFIYIEFDNGELEFYDLVKDPYQLENIASQLAPEILAQLHGRLQALKYCTKDDCRKYDVDFHVNFRK